MDAWITAIVGVVGLGLGWMVSGHQRVTEKLVDERRAAYLALVLEADKVAKDRAASRQTLSELVAKAELSFSVEMRKSAWLGKIIVAVDQGTWEHDRSQFLTIARLESIHNALVLRKWHWRWYRKGQPNIPVR